MALDPHGGGRGTIGWQLKPKEVAKVRGELAAYQEFAALAHQIAEVSEAICEARPVPAASSAMPLTQRPMGRNPDPARQDTGSLSRIS